MKYLKIYTALFKTSFVADLEFRFNFSARIITDIFWYAAQIFTFEVVYLHTQRIGHWDLNQTRVFLGILFVVDAIYMTLFHENLERFTDKVRKGELDLILTKPINSQFIVSLQRAGTASLGNLVMATCWFAWALNQLDHFEWSRLLWLAVMLPAGVCSLYSVRFAFSSVSLLITRSDSVQFIWYQLYKLGMRPDSIYHPWMRYVLLSLVPVSLISSVPARSILDPPSYGLYLWVLFYCPLLLYLSNRFWKYCLSQYSSASS